MRFSVLWVRLTRPRSLTGDAAVCAGGVAKARSGANCASSAMSEPSSSVELSCQTGELLCREFGPRPVAATAKGRGSACRACSTTWGGCRRPRSRYPRLARLSNGGRQPGPVCEAGAAEVARRRRHHVSALTSGGWRIFESKSGKGYLPALRRGCAFVPADSAACTV